MSDESAEAAHAAGSSGDAAPRRAKFLVLSALSGVGKTHTGDYLALYRGYDHVDGKLAQRADRSPARPSGQAWNLA